MEMESEQRESEQNEPALKVLRTLGRNHPLHQQAVSVLADSQAPIQDLKPILRPLTRASVLRRKERPVASWLIAQANWSDDQRQTLAETLSKAVDKATKASRADRILLRWFKRAMLANIVCFGALALLPNIFGPTGIGIAGFCFLLLVLSIPLTLIGSGISVPLSFWIDHRRLKQLGPVVEALGQLGQPVGLASLANASTHSSLREVATPALIKVAAGLKSDDYGTLPQQTVPALCSALTATSPETVLVLLKALALIGDGRAVSSVEFLALNAFRPEVRAAASQLLPLLRQRALEGQAWSLLLRASQAPDNGQTLLRPVREQSVTDPTQLLRMVTSQEDSERP